MNACLLAGALVLVLGPLSGSSQGMAASKAPSVSKVYVDHAGRMHIVESSERSINPKPEKDEVLSSSPAIATDGQTVGWLAEYPNCCTSYPIALKLIIYRSGKIIQRLGDGMLIVRWRFRAGGK